jgi:Bacterial PH domain
MPPEDSQLPPPEPTSPYPSPNQSSPSQPLPPVAQPTPQPSQPYQQTWPEQTTPVPTEPVMPVSPPQPYQQPSQSNQPVQATTLEGIDSDEKLIATIRRHFFGIFIIYFLTTTALIVSIGLVYFLLPNLVDTSQTDVYKTVGVIAAGIVIIMALLLYLATSIYYGSRLILTDHNITQVIRIGIFTKKVSQLDVGNIEDVNANRKGLFATVLNFGTLNIETAGAAENFVFTYCPKPDYYAKEILEARQKVRSMRHEP